MSTNVPVFHFDRFVSEPIEDLDEYVAKGKSRADNRASASQLTLVKQPINGVTQFYIGSLSIVGLYVLYRTLF